MHPTGQGGEKALALGQKKRNFTTNLLHSLRPPLHLMASPSLAVQRTGTTKLDQTSSNNRPNTPDLTLKYWILP
jgi:hypothetical protein